jgi:hypothetical protein
MIDDAAKLVATCEACKKFSHRYRAPAQPSQLIAPLWPLQQWGIDIVDKRRPAQANYTFKVRPVTNITSATIQKFFWQNIICRYRVPQQITMDNAKYFNSAMFKDFYHQVRTKVSFASIYHP